MLILARTILSALTFCSVILATGVVSQPSWGSQGAQGVSLNGTSAQGVSLNGENINGENINGQGAQGANHNGQGAEVTSLGGISGHVVGVELPNAK